MNPEMNDVVFESNSVSNIPATSANLHPELSRLVCAAVVSREFCNLLLKSPAKALSAGYEGEKFRLPPLEKEWVLSIRATSVQDFAAQLMTAMDLNPAPSLVEHELLEPREFELFASKEATRSSLYATRAA